MDPRSRIILLMFPPIMIDILRAKKISDNKKLYYTFFSVYHTYKVIHTNEKTGVQTVRPENHVREYESFTNGELNLVIMFQTELKFIDIKNKDDVNILMKRYDDRIFKICHTLKLMFAMTSRTSIEKVLEIQKKDMDLGWAVETLHFLPTKMRAQREYLMKFVENGLYRPKKLIESQVLLPGWS